MFKYFTLLLALCCTSSAVLAADTPPTTPPPEAAPCAACHGPDGNSPMAMYPKIAGQSPVYLINQLKAFRAGAKGGRTGGNSAIMYGMAANLTDAQIENIAQYYAKQTTSPGGAKKELVASGQQWYKGGNSERGIPACSACHSPEGNGNSLAGFPKLSGQYPEYLTEQLKLFASGERSNDGNRIMRDIAARMSPAEIAAISSYASGLH